jgi:two-component system, cell cycle sensor histidine kinase and response regulator CckA
MGKPLRILLVEDSADDALLLVRELKQAGHDVSYERVDTPAAMERALSQGPWDIVISDHSMPHFSGTAALELVRRHRPDVPFIFVSGTIGEDTAVAAMKAGANDYVLKDSLKRLVPAIERALRDVEGRRERRELEEQLRQAQKMEAIGRLAGGVAHDFNNLLSIIIGYCEILEHHLPTGSPERADLDEIHKAADGAAALTRQLLAFSRRQVLELRQLDLNAVVGKVQRLLQRVVGDDVEVVVKPGDSLPSIRADAGQLEQVLMNLAVNARDAMPDGGSIVLETGTTDLDPGTARAHPGARPGRFVTLSFRDSGSGMDDDTQAHIFEPFFTTKEIGKGTGLGLSTVYGIVQQSEGFLWAESQLGRGTTFRIFLPPAAEDEVVEPGPQAMPQASLGGHETILVVEDSPQLRELLHDVLELRGYRVFDAPNGAVALEAAARHDGPIHLLLTDVIMPGMNGRQLADALLAVRPDLKVLFTSGYPADAIARHGVGAGIAYLQKPFSPEALARKVREVLG